MKRYRMTFAFVIGLLASMAGGCGVFFDFDLRDFLKESGSPELKRFTSESELRQYLREQIDHENSQIIRFDRVGIFEGLGGFAAPLASDSTDAIAEAPPVPGTGTVGGEADGDTSTGGFSQTTIQEQGVDEADVVKTDGTYLYLIDSVAGGGSVLRIVQASPPQEMALLGEIELQGRGRDIYLHGDKVVAITSSGGGLFAIQDGGVAVDSEPISGGISLVEDDTRSDSAGSDGAVPDPDILPEVRYERPKTIVTVVDVAQRDAPAILSTTKFDGSRASSRLIDGVLHLVVSNFQDYYIDVLPLLGQPDLNVADIDTDTLMPAFQRNDPDGVDAAGQVVTWRELYRPTDPDGFGMVYVVSLDVDNEARFTAVGVVAEPGLIYSSRNALYLTDSQFDFSGVTRQTTDIYKLAYQDRGVLPVATGTVKGRVLNQYSMGEYQGHLRVATTIDRSFGVLGVDAESSNNLYVLGTSGTSLAVVGSVEGIAPGETIQSVRLIGPRGYLVTFRQIDPFFTLDLADPTDPRVVGELKVPGFSTFIVPMDENHLLTVGQYIPPPGQFGPWGVQLSIFDVSDFANPRLQDNVIIGGDSGAWSEALSNPKAFTYFAEANLVALPISIQDNFIFFDDPLVDLDFDQAGSDAGGETNAGAPPADDEAIIEEPVEIVEPFIPAGFDGVIVFRASVETGLAELGRLSTRFEEIGLYGPSFTRGIFINDNVYAVTNRALRAAPVAAVESAPFKLVFE